MSNLRLAPTLFALTLAACTVGPDYKRPQIELPAAWPVSAGDAGVSVRWWTLYADAQLNLLVDEALAHNTNLRLAAARVDEARAGLTVVRADSLPNVTAGASAWTQPHIGAQRQLLPGHSDRVQRHHRQAERIVGDRLLGRYRRATEAARGDLLASTSARDAVQLSLISDVVRGYFTLRALDSQIEITHRTIETRRESQRLQRMRYDAGEASQFELRQVEAETAAAEALLPIARAAADAAGKCAGGAARSQPARL